MAVITIRNNVIAMSTARSLGVAQGQVDQSMMRLSTGLRIRSAADDAAGLAVSEKMRAQIGGLLQATRNARDARSLAQTAEASLAEINNLLLRMRDLSVASINDVNTSSERSALQGEVTQLQSEVTRLANTAEFNGQKLLDGTFLGKRFQVGANAGQEVTLSIGGVNSNALGASVTDTDGTITNARPTAPGVAGTNGVAAQTLTVNGPAGSATVDVLDDQTARDVASSINAAEASTGVVASAETNLRLTSAGLNAGVGATVPGDGVISFTLGTASVFGPGVTPILISSRFSEDGSLNTVADAINAQAASTGITASLEASSNGLRLRQADGRDIFVERVRITDASGTIVGGPALTAQGLQKSGNEVEISGASVPFPVDAGVVVGGTVTLRANGTLSLATTAAGTLLSSATAAGTSSTLDSLNVLDPDSASAAIGVIDGALANVNDERANLGAFQNRLDATVANLESTIENLSFAESRVRDADVAQEATTLARSLVLVEAGVAVLAQANLAPRLALRLLGVAAA